MERNKEPTKKKVGRKPLYDKWLTDEGLSKIEGYSKLGLSEEQIAKNMGISGRSLADWKNRFPQILHAIKKGKEVADLEVANALYKCAIGFTGPDGKYYPPQYVPQIFWLKNRQPEYWRDKPREVQDDSETGVIALAEVIKEQEDPDA